MNPDISVDIDFNVKVSSDCITVKKGIFCRFFYYTIYSSKSGKPFKVGRITGPSVDYYRDNLDLDEVVSVTFFCVDKDDKPLVLCIEKQDGRRIYYAVYSKNSISWTQIPELSGVDCESQDKLLLSALKKSYKLFYESVLKIDQNVLRNLTTSYEDIRYEIVPEIYYCQGYDRYFFRPSGPHSLKKIELAGEQLKFDQSLEFVNEIYIYYARTDATSPLLVETKNYEIGDSFPLYNYYIAASIHDVKWTGVACGTNLTSAKCKSDIKRILDTIVYEFKTYPVSVDLEEHEYTGYIRFPLKFSGIYFQFEHQLCSFYGYNSYMPKVTDCALIDKIFIDDREQKVDIQSKEVSVFYTFYRQDNRSKLVLMCFRLFRASHTGQSNFIWFKRDEVEENKWVRINFDGNPDSDHKLIDDKIRSLYERILPDVNVSEIFSCLSFILTGLAVGILAGVSCSKNTFGRIIRYTRLVGDHSN